MATHPPASGRKRRLGEILKEAGLISDVQLQAALAEQRRWGGKLGRTLVEMGFVDEASMAAALSRQLQLPLVDLDKLTLPQDIARWLRVDMAERYGVFPLAHDPKTKVLQIATSDPTNVEALQELAFATGMKIVPSVAGSTSIDRAIRRHYYGERTSASATVTLEELGVTERTVSPQELIEASGGPPAGPSDTAVYGTVDTLGPTSPGSVAQVELVRQLKELGDRLGALERHAANQVRALRALFELLVDKKVISREEYLARVRPPKE